jgi:L-2,4-diaminobutyrate decarboxylase
MPAFADGSPLLAGGTEGTAALRPLTALVLDALEAGAARRCGPLPRGGPQRVAGRVRAVLGGPSGRGVIPEHGSGALEALRSLVLLVAEGAADPADPLCAAHLHCPPLAVAAAADLAASALNPSLDSWDQAPAASELEAQTCAALARLVHRGTSGVGDGINGVDGTHGSRDENGENGESDDAPAALVTTGGTESNQLGVLLAREQFGRGVRVVCGANAHHSVRRAAWLLGLAEPVRVPTPRGVLAPDALRGTLASLAAGASPAPVLVVATAGSTDTGAIDPLAQLADVVREYARRGPRVRYGARLHVDAAYGGMLLFSRRLRSRLAGLERADSVTLDLHKMGWQPIAAGVFTVRDGRALRPLGHRAEYLNAGDDTAAGLPDLLGRSLRTTRRADVLKVAVTLRALGRAGLASLVEGTCGVALRLAELVAGDSRFELFGVPELSTVLFRPAGADSSAVAEVRRRLMADGRAVLGRAGRVGDLWLKATLLNPYATAGDLESLLKLVHDALPSSARASVSNSSPSASSSPSSPPSSAPSPSSPSSRS